MEHELGILALFPTRSSLKIELRFFVSEIKLLKCRKGEERDGELSDVFGTLQSEREAPAETTCAIRLSWLLDQLGCSGWVQHIDCNLS